MNDSHARERAQTASRRPVTRARVPEHRPGRAKGSAAARVLANGSLLADRGPAVATSASPQRPVQPAHRQDLAAATTRQTRPISPMRMPAPDTATSIRNTIRFGTTTSATSARSAGLSPPCARSVRMWLTGLHQPQPNSPAPPVPLSSPSLQREGDGRRIRCRRSGSSSRPDHSNRPVPLATDRRGLD